MLDIFNEQKFQSKVSLQDSVSTERIIWGHMVVDVFQRIYSLNTTKYLRTWLAFGPEKTDGMKYTSLAACNCKPPCIPLPYISCNKAPSEARAFEVRTYMLARQRH